MKDEYIRDFAFDPEFIERKDSIKMHKDRMKKSHKRDKRLMRKFHSIEADNSVPDEEAEMGFEKNTVEEEVISFHTVIITSESPQPLPPVGINHAFAPLPRSPARHFM